MLLLLVIAPLLPPQEPAAGETLVTAERSARQDPRPLGQVTVLSAEDLERTGARSLPQALAAAGGIFVQETNLGGGSPYVRGMIGNQVLIMVDGVRLNDATTRGGPNQSLNNIDPATVERVEIVRGAGSVLYGSDALGGVILITTKRRAPSPEAAGRGVEAFVEGEGRSAVEGWRAAAGASFATGNDGWLGIGSLFDWDDLRPGGGGRVESTGYEGQEGFGSWMHALGSGRALRLTASRHRDLDVPRTDRLNVGFGQTQPSDAEWSYALQDRERYVLGYEDVAAGGFTDAMQARLSLRRYTEEREIRGLTSSTRRLERDQVETVGLSVDWRKAVGDHLLTWGLDVDHDEVDSERQDLDLPTGVLTPRQGAFAPGSRYAGGGAFLQDEILAFEALDVTAGVRWSYFDFAFDDFATGERVDGSFDALTASLQVGRQLTEQSRLTATLSQGFRAPNLADLAKNGSFFGGLELANPDLDPERNWMAELAFDHVRPSWWASLALYYNQIEDVIGARLVDPGGPEPGDETYRRDNVGELRYVGTELSGRKRLGREGSPLGLRGAVEAIWGRQHDPTVDPVTGERRYDDVPARRVPPIHGRVGLEYRPSAPGVRIGWAELAWVWALEQDELNPDDESDPRIDPDGTDAWQRVDLDLGGPIGRASSWSLGVHNLFDERYRVHGSGFDAPGFGVVVGLRFSL